MVFCLFLVWGFWERSLVFVWGGFGVVGAISFLISTPLSLFFSFIILFRILFVPSFLSLLLSFFFPSLNCPLPIPPPSFPFFPFRRPTKTSTCSTKKKKMRDERRVGFGFLYFSFLGSEGCGVVYLASLF